MKTAIFSDVHGNIIALKQFLEAVKEQVQSYICLGDIVNYGPWNDQCLQTIVELPNCTILEGNHERLFLGTENLSDEIQLVQDFSQVSYSYFERKDLISSLPQYLDLGDFRCIHTINHSSVYPDSDITVDRNFIIGHSHHQFNIQRSGYTIINPGSIGQNRKWINRVEFAVFDTETQHADFSSIEYDVDAFISELVARDYPQNCIDYYKTRPRN